MFSVHAIMVPTVALTPPPDQAEANWLLTVTFFSLPLCLSLCVSQWSTFGHPEAVQCHFMPSNGRESLIHHEANLQFPGAASVRQTFVCIACLGLFYISVEKKGPVGWVIVSKKLRFYIYAERCSCRLFLPCQIQSRQRQGSGCWEVCGVAGGW